MDFNALLATFADNLLPILLLGGAGFLVGKVLSIESRGLGRVVFYVFSPVLVFDLLLHTELSSADILSTVGFAVAACLATGLLALGVGRLWGFERPILMAVILTSAFGNTGNYGLPLVSFAYGQAALAVATIYFVTNSVQFNTAGVVIASLGHLDLRTAVSGLFKVPAVYGVVLAVLLNHFQLALPTPLERTVALAADGSIPLMIVLLGLELSRVQWSHSARAIGLSTVIRLLVAPAAGLLLAGVFGFSGPARQANVTECAMPAAVTNTILASEYGLDSSLVTAMIFIATILSPLTLTPLVYYLGR